MPTSDDLLNRRFEKSGFGGYKAADVDNFMAELANVLSQKNREILELKRRLLEAQNRLREYQSEEESLKTALLNAQRLADKIVNEANAKADAVIGEAEDKAQAMLRSAKLKAENLIDCAQSEIDIRKQEAQRLKQEITDFKLSVMRLYKSHLELINEIPAEYPPEEDDEQGQDMEPEPEAQQREADSAAEEKDAEENKAQENTEANAQNEPSTQAQNEPKTNEAAENAQINAPGNTVSPTAQPGRTAYPIRTQAATPEKPQEAAQEEPSQGQPQAEPLPQEAELAHKEAAAAMPAVKLNLRYNEKTGEYEPIDIQATDGDNQFPRK